MIRGAVQRLPGGWLDLDDDRAAAGAAAGGDFLAACALVAGVFGGATVAPRIYVIQALPAALCLISISVFGI